jgi:cell division protein ZapA
MSKAVTLTVSILDREYRVACEEHEKAVLRDSAELLDQRMREVRDGGRVVGLERIAIMAGLNIARDVVESEQSEEQQEQQLSLQLDRVRELLDEAEGQA